MPPRLWRGDGGRDKTEAMVGRVKRAALGTQPVARRGEEEEGGVQTKALKERTW